jgi:thioredoxin 1
MPRFFAKTLMATAAVLVAGCTVPATPQPGLAEDKKVSKEESVLAVSDANFSKEVLKSDKTVLVDFWAPWCGPCRMQGPIVEEVSNELKTKAKVVKLNTDDNPKTASAYNITGIPALIIFKNGKVVEQKVGLTRKEELIQTINKHL